MDICGVSKRFERQAAEAPDGLAATDDRAELTHGDLNAAANRVAHRLVRLAAGRGPTAAVLCDHRVERVIATVAILKSPLGLVVLDATYPDAALADLLDHAETVAVVADEANADRARRLAGPGRSVIVVGSEVAAEPATNLDLDLPLTALGALRYTSGSTGKPKGVVHTRGTLAFLATRSIGQHRLTHDDRLTVFNPFWQSQVCAVLMSGASLHLYDLKRRGMARVGSWLNDQRITVYSSFPTAFRQFVAGVEPGFRAETLRSIGLSGESALAADVEAARRFCRPDCVFINGFGSTEFSQIAEFSCTVDASLPPGLLPAGRPIPGIELVVLDEDGRPLPRTQRGEIAVRTAYLTSGYWHEPELTRRMYTPDPDNPGSNLYLTGDVGWVDADGNLHVAGRRDQQVKIRGHRVLPNEIEQALMTHPGVAEAAVTTFAANGEAPRLAAYVVNGAENVPDMAGLREFLAARLPSYMVPTWITSLDRLPQTATGKVDRRALPPPGSLQRETPEPVFHDQVERDLATLWRDLLRRPSLGRDDDFFLVGGDSLAATTVILEIARRYGVEILPQDIADAGRTLAGLAALIRARRGSGPAPGVPADVDFAELGAPAERGRNAALFYVDPALSLRRARPGARWGGIAINALGFRGPEIARNKPPGTARLAFLGDSATFDTFVAESEGTWPSRVATTLASRFPHGVIDHVNAALPGYGSRQLALLYPHAVAHLEPDIVVVGISDMNADTARLARQRGTHIGLHDRPSRLAHRWPLWAKAAKTARSVERRTAAMLGQGLRDIPPDLPDAFAERLEGLVKAAVATGAVPVVMLMPRRLRRDQGTWRTFRALASSAYFMPHLSLDGHFAARALYDAATIRVAERTGACLIDARDALPPDARHFHDSAHYTPAGSRRLADYVAACLLADRRTRDRLAPTAAPSTAPVQAAR